MTQGWNFDSGNQGSGGGKKQNFTKFPVGVTRIRVLDDAPNVRWVHWMPQFSRSVNCPGRGCPIDEIRKQQKANGEPYSYNMSRRFAINIYNHDTGLQEIMEQGIGFMEDLRDLMTDLQANGKSLNDVILKVRRRGTGKDDTSYRVDIDVEEPMSVVEQSAKNEKIDLTEYFKPHTPEQILELLQFRGATKEEYTNKWIEVTNPTPNEGTSEEIEIR